MDPELLAALGLSEDATLEDALSAINVLKAAANPDPDGDEEPSDDADPDADTDDDSKKEKMKAKARREASAALANAGNSAILAELKKMNKGLTALGARVDGNERLDIIKANAKKFTPALEKLARKWDIATLKDFVAAAPDAAESDEEPEDDGAARGPAALGKSKKVELNKAELEMCKATGRKPATVLAFKQKQAEKESA
jgi:hypothetical protein